MSHLPRFHGRYRGFRRSNRLGRGLPASVAVLALAALLPLAPAAPARAQDEQSEEQYRQAPANPNAPQTLGAALKITPWRAAQRGPLFAVNPQAVRQWRPERDPHTPQEAPQPIMAPLGPPDGPNGTYRLETIAPYFGRKITRVGSVTVLAPTDMVVLNDKLPPVPDPMAGLSRQEKIQILQASLTDAQWKQLSSTNGLGVDGMDATQQKLYLGILPDPFIVTPYKFSAEGYYESFSQGQGPQKTTLSDGERRQVRLRMNRAAQMTIPSTTDKNGGYGEYVSPAVPGKTTYQVSHSQEYNNPDAFGVLLRARIPAKLKPSQIDFANPALDAQVDLRGVKTVGVLVERIAKATGLDFIADARVAALPLWVYGDPPAPAPKNANGSNGSNGANNPAPPPAAETPAPTIETEPAPARSGDALKALCWAVTGAVRKVGPVFLLTDDIEGIGTRQARITRWKNEGEARKSQIMTKYEQTVRAAQPMKFTEFSASDAAALSPEAMKKVEEGWTTIRGRYQGTTVAPSEMNDVQQKMVRKAIENHQARITRGEKNVRPIVLDRVQVSVRPKIVYVLPDNNEADCDVYLSLDSFLPPAQGSWDGKPLPSTDPIVLPTILPQGGVVLASPRSEAEIALLLDAAKTKNLSGVWLCMDGLDGKPLLTPDLLARAVQMGKERGLPVFAVVRLLLAPGTPDTTETAGTAGTPPAETRNVTITENTGAQIAQMTARTPERYPGENVRQKLYSVKADWLRPNAPQTLPLVKARLLKIAQTPGLAGVVIRNAAADGYGQKETQMYGQSLGSDFGYTPANRLACLKNTHIDPIDLGTNGDYGDTNLSLPFFAQESPRIYMDDGVKINKAAVAPYEAWKTQRFEQNARFLGDLWVAFRKENPALPLFIADLSENYNVTFVSWDKADGFMASKPYDYNNDDNNLSQIAQARKNSQTVLTDIPCGYAIAPRYPNAPDDGVEPGSGQAFARFVNAFLRPMQELQEKKLAPGSRPTWDGIVLDFGELPVGEAVELMKSGMAAPKKP